MKTWADTRCKSSATLTEKIMTTYNNNFAWQNTFRTLSYSFGKCVKVETEIFFQKSSCYYNNMDEKIN